MRRSGECASARLRCSCWPAPPPIARRLLSSCPSCSCGGGGAGAVATSVRFLAISVLERLCLPFSRYGWYSARLVPEPAESTIRYCLLRWPAGDRPARSRKFSGKIERRRERGQAGSRMRCVGGRQLMDLTGVHKHTRVHYINILMRMYA